MRKITLSCLFITIFGGILSGQPQFVGKVIYKNYMQNPDSLATVYNRVAIEYQNGATIEEREYKGKLALTYPKTSINTDTASYTCYNSSPDTFFMRRTLDSMIIKRNLIATNEKQVIAGYLCTKNVLVSQTIDNKTLVTYFWLADKLPVVIPKYDYSSILRFCPLKIMDLVEDINGNLMNVSVLEATSVIHGKLGRLALLLEGKTIKQYTLSEIKKEMVVNH